MEQQTPILSQIKDEAARRAKTLGGLGFPFILSKIVARRDTFDETKLPGVVRIPYSARIHGKHGTGSVLTTRFRRTDYTKKSVFFISLEKELLRISVFPLQIYTQSSVKTQSRSRPGSDPRTRYK